MAKYRYAGNRTAGDTTVVIKVNEKVSVGIGQVGEFSDSEVASLSRLFVLDPIRPKNEVKEQEKVVKQEVKTKQQEVQINN